MPGNHVPLVKVARFMPATSFAIAFRASASRNGRSRVGLHEEDLRAAERDVRAEREALVRRELQARVAVRQLCDRDLGLEPAELGAQAPVHALAKRKMLGCIAAVQIELVRVAGSSTSQATVSPTTRIWLRSRLP
jgi:hypothetical protein